MTTTKNCPRCGIQIRANESPADLCSACLMKAGLESRIAASAAEFAAGSAGPRPAAPTVAELAPHFPELEIRELVGRGGMGAVYRARQISLDRDVALKVLTIGGSDVGFAERFEREARTLAGLSHAGIVSVLDYGQRGPWSFLAMEFVDGASLREMLRAHDVGSREALSIVAQLCDALQYAHDHGVVHRDIKPENILVTRRGQVKVLDFGLAKLVTRDAERAALTHASQVMGTPHYMAPEQWEKPLTVDHRADIYALGVVFYELLTGELPIGRFAAPSMTHGVDARLDDVVNKTLEKEPDRRYQHASEVKADVTGIGSSPVPAPTRAARSRTHKVVFGCVALMLVAVALLVTAAVGFVFLPNQRSATRDAAEAAARSAREMQFRALDLAAAPIASESPTLRKNVDETGLEEVSAVVRDAWASYLEAERANAHVIDSGPTSLHFAIEPFTEIRALLIGRIQSEISKHTGSADDARTAVLEMGVERSMCMGVERVEVALQGHGELVDVLSLAKTPPEQAASFQRVWRHFMIDRNR